MQLVPLIFSAAQSMILGGAHGAQHIEVCYIQPVHRRFLWHWCGGPPRFYWALNRFKLRS